MKAPSLNSRQALALPRRATLKISGKNTLHYVTVFLFSLLFHQLRAQTFPPGNPANFGIDGDIYTGQRQQGSFTAAGSHDWFKISNGTGMAIFDTIDAAKYRTQAAQGKNILISKKMQYAAYTIQNGYLMLDGTYSRDYFGNDTTLDRTIFSTVKGAASQNAQNPADWITYEKGDVLPSKSDIIDTYIHMRRNGTSVEIGKASPLIVYFGASTLSTNGDHHVDFELFKSPIKYGGGRFDNSSLTKNTGGRDPWEFNPDGSVKSFGGMSFSFSFNSSQVTDVAIYIWVSYTTYSTIKPKDFDFLPDEWNGLTPKGGYGFARVVPKPGRTLPAWGAVNTAQTQAPVWGTNSKELGAQATNYYTTKYSAGQFAEAAVDLSALGVDPALSTLFDKCSPPYRRVLMKTRSSDAFSSALQDFAGPFEFLDAPTIPADIITPGNLTCATPTLTLQPVNNITGASYLWKTTDGNIVSGANTATPVIDKPGKYELTASLYEGCSPSKSNVKVVIDTIRPVATAKAVDIMNGSSSYVQLEGGDPAASNPLGNSQGLLWNWSGPNNFTASTQNTKTTIGGQYQLIVTEKRNGCTDTAFATVTPFAEKVLPIVLKSFAGAVHDGQAQLQWSVEENETGDRFEVQRSLDGRNFHAVAQVFTTGKAGAESYRIKEKMPAEKAYYRLLIINKNSSTAFSHTLMLQGQNNSADGQLRLLQNPALSTLQCRFVANAAGSYTATVYSISGIKLQQSTIVCGKGVNVVSVPLRKDLQKGSYVLEVAGNSDKQSTLFLKQ